MPQYFLEAAYPNYKPFWKCIG